MFGMGLSLLAYTLGKVFEVAFGVITGRRYRICTYEVVGIFLVAYLTVTQATLFMTFIIDGAVVLMDSLNMFVFYTFFFGGLTVLIRIGELLSSLSEEPLNFLE